ncbi:hypothetical protein EDB89DRAFT_1910566 [Lactarius sanguifluus]|nr:hypothetical protein EDB89DRAFT_1910566 [Lactarius sanguifluus]
MPVTTRKTPADDELGFGLMLPHHRCCRFATHQLVAPVSIYNIHHQYPATRKPLSRRQLSRRHPSTRFARPTTTPTCCPQARVTTHLVQAIAAAANPPHRPNTARKTSNHQLTTMPPQHGTPRLGRRARPCRPATPLQRDTQGPSHHRPPRHVDTARNTPPPADSMPCQDPATANPPRRPNAAHRTLLIRHATPTRQLLPRHPGPATATLALLPPALAAPWLSL